MLISGLVRVLTVVICYLFNCGFVCFDSSYLFNCGFVSFNSYLLNRGFLRFMRFDSYYLLN